MANMTFIDKVVLTGSQSTIEFANLNTYSSTYTDLVILISARQSNNAQWCQINFNNSSSSYSNLQLYGAGSGSGTFDSGSTPWSGAINSSPYTTNAFANTQVYIPNFSSSNHKVISYEGVQETDTTTSYMAFGSTRWAVTDPITNIKIIPQSGTGLSFVEGSTFYLYGISKVTSSPKATGGIVSQDASYWYHMFPYTSTFTPTTAITCDYLVIAGGGGGGWGTGGGGGGAGGLRSTVTATGGGGSLESTLSLSAQAYTVTVGAGGAGLAQSPGTVPANPGSNSTFSTITSQGGGGGGSETGDHKSGGNGGSGGGANYLSGAVVGTGTANQGYAGGTQSGYCGGAGGGAGAVGGNASSPNGGTGGAGVSISAFANATFTGVNTYYAGGGGGGAQTSINTQSYGGPGGTGGGGLGAGYYNNSSGISPTSGIANTGSGGGGGGAFTGGGSGSGGSGIVIVRYAK
jgi:hypothetical protein